jgi:hypothetical protein
MKKTRSDAKWLALAPDQAAQLEKWLLQENLSYDDAHARAKAQFGFAGSVSSLRRFRQGADQRQLLRLLRESGREAGEISGAGVTQGALRESGMTLLSRQFFQSMKSEAPADPPTLAKLALQSESNELRRQSQELRQRQLRFQERRWEFDIEEQAKLLVPECQELLKRLGPDKNKRSYREMINMVRMKLFGCAPDCMPPEDEEEEQQEEESPLEPDAQASEPGDHSPGELPSPEPGPETQEPGENA